MSKQPPMFEKIKEKYGAYPKPMMVNLEVAKTVPFKTQTRRLDAKWKVGDVLWVREPAEVMSVFPDKMTMGYLYGADEQFSENIKHISIPERFIDMDRTNEIVPNFDLIKPKWIREMQGIPNGCTKEMARTFLRVVEVREEFLQDISEEDCLAEGIQMLGGGEIADTGDYFDVEYVIGAIEWTDDDMYIQNEIFEFAEDAFESLWNSTAPKGFKWEDNPKIKVIVLEKIEV